MVVKKQEIDGRMVERGPVRRQTARGRKRWKTEAEGS